MMRFTLLALLMLSLSGCISAVPMAMQMMSGGSSGSSLCSFAKLPGQTASLCDRFGSSTQTPEKAVPVTTAAR